MRSNSNTIEPRVYKRLCSVRRVSTYITSDASLRDAASQSGLRYECGAQLTDNYGETMALRANRSAEEIF